MKKLLFCLFTFYFSVQINAQIDFEDHDIIIDRWLLNELRYVEMTDLDSDGDLDWLVGRDVWNIPVQWYENTDGLGGPGIRQEIETDAQYVSQVKSADIDNDGDMDVLSIGYDDMSWYENIDGQGNFGPANLISSGTDELTNARLVDVNGDSFVDLVVFNYETTEVLLEWRANDGNGNFGPWILIDDVWIFDYELADVDGDSDPDVIRRLSSGFSWQENMDGMGNFDEIHPISGGATTTSDMAIGDIDGDGDLDIVHASGVSGNFNVSWSENTDGLGTFGPANVLLGNTVMGTQLALLDFDDDSDLDIIKTSAPLNQLSWFENLDGLGSFSNEIILSETIREPLDLKVADIDQDSYDDIVLISGSTPTRDGLYWLRNQDGTEKFTFPISMSKTAIYINSLAVADLNGDGSLDIIDNAGTDRELHWYPNLDGLGDFRYQHVVPVFDVPFWPLKTVPIDIDLDGDIDLITSTESPGRMYFSENIDGTGNFAVPIEIIGPTTDVIVDFFLTDFDSDDDKDIVLATEDGKIYWKENLNGLGDFDEISLVASPSFEIHLFHSFDMNGDNLHDFAVVLEHSGDTVLKVYRNNGDGTISFVTDVFGDTPFNPGELTSGDVNGDGMEDLVLSHLSAGTVSWFLNLDNNGQFSPEYEFNGENTISGRKIDLVDVDEDTFPDLIYRSSSGPFRWAKNTGEGFINSETYFLTDGMINGERGITHGDLDGDSDNDIILATGNPGGYMRWCENPTIILGNKDNEIDKINSISIYPNPSKNQINITTINPISHVELYDLTGRKVFTEDGCDCSKQKITFNLNSGIYLVKVKTSNETADFKLIVE